MSSMSWMVRVLGVLALLAFLAVGFAARVYLKTQETISRHRKYIWVDPASSDFSNELLVGVV